MTCSLTCSFPSATHTARPDFCLSAITATAHGYKLNVVGPDRSDQMRTIGLLDKLWAIRDFLALVPDHPSTVVAFVDAYDVLFNGSPKKLVSGLVSSGYRVLFAAEKGCCRCACSSNGAQLLFPGISSPGSLPPTPPGSL